MSNHKFSPELSTEERQEKFLAMSDEDIDYSDIPPLDDEFFKNAKRVTQRSETEQISIRLDTEILEWFRNHAQEESYQTLINDVLRTYIKHQS
ncbi:MAG: BrnA antitoxin family protein [Snowella sp.]|nr:BrnA antitoxin family protein [Snowella sp.]